MSAENTYRLIFWSVIFLALASLNMVLSISWEMVLARMLVMPPLIFSLVWLKQRYSPLIRD